jgi:hypothetical protein
MPIGDKMFKKNLQNAWKVIELYEEATEGKSKAQKLVDYLKETITPLISSGKYFQVRFEKDHGEHGIVILKYANIGKDSTPKEAEEAKHAMVSFEGFDKEGNINTPDDKITAHFFKYNLKVKNPGKIRGGCKKVSEWFIRWFKKNLDEITRLNESDMALDGGGSPTGGGAMGSWNSVTGGDIPQKCDCVGGLKDPCPTCSKKKDTKKKVVKEEGEGGVAPGTASDGGPVSTLNTTTTKNVAVYKRPVGKKKDVVSRPESFKNFLNKGTRVTEAKKKKIEEYQAGFEQAPIPEDDEMPVPPAVGLSQQSNGGH